MESLHTFLPIPLLAPALSATAVSCLAVPLLAQGAGTPQTGDDASSSQHKDSHRLEQGSPCLPGVPPAPGGRAVRRSHKQTKKTPEYFRKVFFFPLHPYFQSSSQLSGQPAELLSGPVSPCPAPRDAPAATKPSQVVPSANPRVFFIIYIFFLVLFFSTLAFSHAIRLPLAPLPLPPPQALGWPRGCEVRGGSGGCGGLCIDALIAHGLRLTSLLPGKQSPWLLALLLQRRL